MTKIGNLNMKILLFCETVLSLTCFQCSDSEICAEGNYDELGKESDNSAFTQVSPFKTDGDTLNYQLKVDNFC